MGASCERDDNYDPDSIIGKWKGLYGTSTTLIEDELPRLEGGVVIWTFTKDGCFNISYNGETTFKTDYYVSGDTLNILIENGLMKSLITVSNDTLSLYEYVSDSHYFYKRIE